MFAEMLGIVCHKEYYIHGEQNVPPPPTPPYLNVSNFFLVIYRAL